MVFGLLATELPAEKRSPALNLVYLPLYAAGLIGQAIGAVVASVSGIDALFVLGAAVFAFGAVTVLRRGQPGRRLDTTNAASPSATSEPAASASASRVSTKR
jgi:hypothetical protein